MSRQWTEEQSELLAINPDNSFVLPIVAVSADAGTGKTSVLEERVKKYLTIKSNSNKQVLCVSFTEKSAADIEERLGDLPQVSVYTIHGFCARLIKEFGSWIGLSPLWGICGKNEASKIFYESYKKMFRIQPPEISSDFLDHDTKTFETLCEIASARTTSNFEIITNSANSHSIRNFVNMVLEEYTRRKQRLGYLDYQDLERRAIKLLRQKPIKSLIQNRYAHVFIDEFQDTSPIQCELMESLLSRHTNLFLVGDVKQSIYRFRGAEVEVFNEFSKKCAAQRRLSKNFRSHDEVIEAINSVFTALPPNYTFNYLPMSAVRQKEVFTFSKTLPRVARIECKTNFDGVIQNLKKLRQEGVDYSQIALLLPRIRGNEEMLESLLSAGVSLTISSSGGLELDQRFLKIVNLWKWSCEPWQKLLLAKTMVDFPQFKWTRDFLEKISFHWDTPLEHLKSLDKLFNLRKQFGVFYDQFENHVCRKGFEGYSIADLGNIFSNLEDNRGLDFIIPPSPQIQGLLRVFTIHASKGLEFPVVLLADLKAKNTKLKGALLASRTGDTTKIFLAPKDEKGKIIKDPEFKEVLEKEKALQEQENARLLYVAMTRAQEALWIIDSDPDPKPASWSFWIKNSKIKTENIFLKNELLGAASLTPETIFTTDDPLEKNPPKYCPSRLAVTSLEKTLSLNTLYLEAAYQSSQDDSHIQARDVGILFHSFLEAENWDGLKKSAKNLNVNLTEFLKWLETPEAIMVFGPHSGHMRLEREFPFEWLSPTYGMLTGRIDRLVIFKDLTAWIIDYKVLAKNWTIGELEKQYGAQLQIYAEVVSKITPFKKIQKFIIDITCATGKIFHEI